MDIISELGNEGSGGGASAYYAHPSMIPFTSNLSLDQRELTPDLQRLVWIGDAGLYNCSTDAVSSLDRRIGLLRQI